MSYLHVFLIIVIISSWYFHVERLQSHFFLVDICRYPSRCFLVGSSHIYTYVYIYICMYIYIYIYSPYILVGYIIMICSLYTRYPETPRKGTFLKKGTFFNPLRELLCWRKNPVWRPETCFWHACTMYVAQPCWVWRNSWHDSYCAAHAAADILATAGNFLTATAASYARLCHSVFTSRWFARFWRQGPMAALVWIAAWTCLRSLKLPSEMASGWKPI